MTKITLTGAAQQALGNLILSEVAEAAIVPLPLGLTEWELRNGPIAGKRYGTKLAAFWLGLEENTGAEVIRDWYRTGEVLQPGTEIVKMGARITVDVSAVRSRLAKEQKQIRKV